MKIRRFICAVICIVLAAACIATFAACEKNPPNNVIPESDTLYVKKAVSIPEEFVMGMDASCVISLEKSGVKYYDFDGNEADVFKVLADNGINTIRVRVWNKPYQGNDPSTEKWYGGGNCDINTAIAIGKRATKYNMGLMVDFHYSDFWADPSKQMVPEEWKGLDITAKSQELYKYTKESLQKLKKEKVNVTMVQIGNETNGKMCGEITWENIAKLMSAGSKAIKEVYKDALRVLHFTNPEDASRFDGYATQLANYGVEYEVFATSYYPYWHGTLTNLSKVLGDIAQKYDKKVMVAETSYAFTDEDSDFNGNTIGAGQMNHYPFTVQGQANCIRDIINCISRVKNGIGVCYWEGTWISVGGSSWEENSALWEKYGSGWASSYAAEYDPNDAGRYYGGCAVDNQAFFDSTGHPLESLKVFGLVRTGNKPEVKADALENAVVQCEIGNPLALPKKVNAIMTDDSRCEVDVVWNVTPAQIAQMETGGTAKYSYTGTAEGLTAYLTVSMSEPNQLKNFSFEADDDKTATPTNWTLTANKTSNELYVSNNANNALSGGKSYHFWSQNANTVNFDLEQEVQGLKAGTYKFTISVMGGDGGTVNIYSYVKINGEIAYKMEGFGLNGYQAWDTKVLEGIQYNGTDTITVGIHVECSGEGNGAWGNVDDAMLNFVSE